MAITNKQLHKAKDDKKDEFYTRSTEIENELRHYEEQFKDKVVFCNCDDPYESEFFKYFAKKFNTLGLKKLICTCYDESPIMGEQLSFFDLNYAIKPKKEKQAYKIVINNVKDMNKDGAIDLSDVKELIKDKKNTLTLLNGDGDFRSKECIDLLKESDIVITNPPFSLFREFINQLMEYDKKFLIIGNQNAITYKEVFPLIRDNKIWTGYSFNKTMIFNVPEHYKSDLRDDNGDKIVKVPAITWFTNLDVKKRYEKTIPYLTEKYTNEKFPTYENFDAIEINKTINIPNDYYGKMGVPITFLDKYNPDEFKIIGLAHGDQGSALGLKPYDRKLKKLNNGLRDGDVFYIENGIPKVPYARIIIERIKGDD